MKKILFSIAILLGAIGFFSSCEKDVSTKNWLNHTSWKADLTQYGDWDKGDVKIVFKRNGYDITIDAEKTGAGGSYTAVYFQGETIGELSLYEFPDIEIPLRVKDRELNEVQVFWKGKFSEDRKQLTIERLEGFIDLEDCRNIVFKR